LDEFGAIFFLLFLLVWTKPMYIDPRSKDAKFLVFFLSL
jgi:hypothetical protein